MKVVHVPFGFAPDPMGGTEIYVHGLIRSLRVRGIEGVVVAPGKAATAYQVDGAEVRRFAVTSGLSLEELYGEGDAPAARAFADILDSLHPGLVHFHAYTSAVSLLSLREARRRGLPTIFTYHTSTATCVRGTLLELGATVCDGRMEAGRCSRCVLQLKGLPDAVAGSVGRLPDGLRRLAADVAGEGRARTALQMPDLLARRQRAVEEFIRGCDRIVAPATWVRDLLARNGFAPEKVVFCRQGVTAGEARANRTAEGAGGPLRVAWLGRLDATKGLHVLVDTLALDSAMHVTLDAYAIEGHADGNAYADGLRRRIAADSRIRLHPALDPSEVIGVLAGYDALAVPSQLLETGPLVVLEAFAAGIPVIGSRLGGIAEFVEHERDGLLVDMADSAAWRDAFRRLAMDRAKLARLAEGIRRPRTMDEVAIDMERLYRELARA